MRDGLPEEEAGQAKGLCDLRQDPQKQLGRGDPIRFLSATANVGYCILSEWVKVCSDLIDLQPA